MDSTIVFGLLLGMIAWLTAGEGLIRVLAHLMSRH